MSWGAYYGGIRPTLITLSDRDVLDYHSRKLLRERQDEAVLRERKSCKGPDGDIEFPDAPPLLRSSLRKCDEAIEADFPPLPSRTSLNRRNTSMATDQQVDAALDLLRRLPPADTDANLDRIITLAPDLQDELLESVDVQLKIKRCSKTGRDFLCCDYNRDGDSYRSPWSNEFEPPIEDDDGGTKPSERLRQIEVRMGEAIDVYRELYYEGGISSVYFWDLDDGFAGVVLIKKSTPKDKGDGVWDSIHVFEAIDRARTAHYKLTTTVILHLGSSSEKLGQINLGGNMVYQKESDLPVEDDNSHIVNLGRMIEDMETKHRGMLNEVYFGKARDIIGDLRSIAPLTQANADRAAQREMISEWSKQGARS